ncbi:MAG: hypothetical protein O7H41_05135 [Planctomycetota bacterium]|nr:hypothetical protein [Planctomycetota bacterium]
MRMSALGKLLDLFLFREIRSAIKEVLGIEVSNGNGRQTAVRACWEVDEPEAGLGRRKGRLPGGLFFRSWVADL